MKQKELYKQVLSVLSENPGTLFTAVELYAKLALSKELVAFATVKRVERELWRAAERLQVALHSSIARELRFSLAPFALR